MSLQAWLFDSVTYELSWLLADAQHSIFQKNQLRHDYETLFETGGKFKTLRITLAEANHYCTHLTFRYLTFYIRELRINHSFEEIKNMTRKCFRKLTKTRAFEAAFLELKRKEENGIKGRTLKYGEILAMADYLCPNSQLSVQDQRDTFQIRSRKICYLPIEEIHSFVRVEKNKITITFYYVILQIQERRFS